MTLSHSAEISNFSSRNGGDIWEFDTSPDFRYATWRMNNKVRGVYDSVIAQDYAPQILKAYDESNNPIHPNDVPAALSGALVSVTCTLEKMLFVSKNYTGGKEWQMYANVAKVQILRRPPVARARHVDTPAPKRRLESGHYGSSDHSTKRPAA
ncbi:hypothetical protein FRC10_008797 [Ceratobasidium sp. 414]|nr:hypothetical protein FRC10_008797 [Ceratobasidium sp. 414]